MSRWQRMMAYCDGLVPGPYKAGADTPREHLRADIISLNDQLQDALAAAYARRRATNLDPSVEADLQHLREAMDVRSTDHTPEDHDVLDRLEAALAATDVRVVVDDKMLHQLAVACVSAYRCGATLDGCADLMRAVLDGEREGEG